MTYLTGSRLSKNVFQVGQFMFYGDLTIAKEEYRASHDNDKLWLTWCSNRFPSVDIVKMQSSLESNLPFRSMLAYNKQRTLEYEGKLTTEVEKLLGIRPKAYFYVTLDKTREWVILSEAPKQTW